MMMIMIVLAGRVGVMESDGKPRGVNSQQALEGAVWHGSN